MALLKIDNLRSGAILGMWRIEETVSEMLAMMPSLGKLQHVLDSYSRDARRLEVLSVHALVYIMTGDESLVVGHNEDGHPLLEGWHVSISHTRGYAAVLLSRQDEVAVDVEYVSNRVAKIADRFIRDDEQDETITRQLVCWCTKEAVYKYFSSQHLALLDIRLRNYELSSEGCIVAENMQTGDMVTVNYNVTDSYVMTYIIP
ncbi:MAG: 4'-phosphopantetheinyl transferase family protein [Prevotella sp.]